MRTWRSQQPPMAEPLAYFITWATYGTWLPGDERGWVEYRRGWQLPDRARKLEAEAMMSEDACRLDRQQRELVERQIAETCGTHGWKLHAVNCRSNHVHVVVSANRPPKVVRSQLKAWCTQRLREHEAALRTRTRSVSEADTLARSEARIRENWWAERGSQRYINDENGLEAAILYVLDGQDRRRSHQPEASARNATPARRVGEERNRTGLADASG